MSESQQLVTNPPEGLIAGPVSEENYFEWEAAITGPQDSFFEDGVFIARLTFPQDYPLNPPKMRFISKIFHPNIYPDGRVCISILHAPGTDRFNEQETADERWRPILGVHNILMSVISMLVEPNLNSPANIDAAVNLKNAPDEYKKRVRELTRRSIEDPP